MADLVQTQLNKSLRAKTLSDLVRVRAGETIYLLLDVSGSMRDEMRNGKTRIEGLGQVVRDIQSKRPIKMIAFGAVRGDDINGSGAYVTDHVPHAAGGTPLHAAIDLAKTMAVSKCIVISDGMPDRPGASLEAARNFGGQIDVVFVGDPGEPGDQFLKELAAATGGTQFNGDLSQPKELVQGIMGLLKSADDDDDE